MLAPTVVLGYDDDDVRNGDNSVRDAHDVGDDDDDDYGGKKDDRFQNQHVLESRNGPRGPR